jgi:SAM-dependent methyltransferase
MTVKRGFMTDIFFELHQDLPREGPGDADSTLRAFRMMEGLPSNPRILDVGCGPGMQTLDLAKHTRGNILAIDTHQPFLDELLRRAKGAGLSDQISARNESMFELNFPEGSFDIIWSEGAIYNIGFEAGLKKVHPLLTAGGYAAITEISWLKPNPPDEVFQFWQKDYPGMGSVEENLLAVERASYRTLGHFTLPDSSWWDNYFNPLKERIAMLREKYPQDPEAQSVLDEQDLEMELFQKYSDCFGYEFYVMQKE